MLRAEGECRLGIQSAGGVEFGVGHLLRAVDAVIGDSQPFAQFGKGAFPQHASAQLLACLCDRDRAAAAGGDVGALKACRSSSNDEDRIVRTGWRQALGMPPAPQLLYHRRVLRAANGRSGVSGGRFTDALGIPVLDGLGLCGDGVRPHLLPGFRRALLEHSGDP